MTIVTQCLNDKALKYNPYVWRKHIGHTAKIIFCKHASIAEIINVLSLLDACNTGLNMYTCMTSSKVKRISYKSCIAVIPPCVTLFTLNMQN